MIIACEDPGLEVDKNVMRGIPFFGMMGKLLSVLKMIMIPYLIRVLSRLNAVVGRKITGAATDTEDALSKKGKRAWTGTYHGV